MVAGEHDIRPTCLSDLKHDCAIQNHVLHYLGCIERRQQETFYEQNSDLWKKELKNERQRQKTESQDPQRDGALETAEVIVTKRLQAWQQACETEVRRIDYLRALLAKDKDKGVRQLVHNLEKSRGEWRNTGEYQSGLQNVKLWRAQLSTPISKEKTSPISPEDLPETDPRRGRDNQPRQQQSVLRHHHTEPSSSSEPLQTPGSSTSLAEEIKRRKSKERPHEDYEPEKDFNLHIIEYEDIKSQDRVEESQLVHTKQKLPDQKVKVHEILEKNVCDLTDNPLYRGKKSGKLSYIHIPANNMLWVEEAIARYYGEQRPSYDGIYRELPESDRTHTSMILRPQFWRGQQHGGRSAPPHARHMRPLCKTVSSNPTSVDQVPKNLVLFMPYLHWETDRQRERFAAKIENITDNWKNKKYEDWRKRKQTRQKQRQGLKPPKFEAPEEKEENSSFWSKVMAAFRGRTSQSPPAQPVTQTTIDSTPDVRGSDSGVNGAQYRSLPTLLQALGCGDRKRKLDDSGRFKTKSKLGQFIIDASRLYEEMSNYRDEKLLQKYLHYEPPMHPRRTLDQSYYWTLNKTSVRDRDQVVYRSTQPGIFHEYDHKKGEWPEHKEQGITLDRGCNHCQANIRKVSRVIMVDQLWMWILDEQTIITCFPKRYGSNKQENDRSSVHKSIRLRLQNARQNYIRSVFDLALIIIDECSNAFFDRTKTRDRQPQVMDAFSEAVGNVTHKQTAAFERLYLWTNSASKIFKDKGKVDSESIRELDVPLLDIYPEGILQREIKDIIEELDIMIEINRTQQQVLSDFIMHVKHILDPEGIQDGADGRKNNYVWFKLNANEILAKVQKRIAELEVLKRTAQGTSSSLTDLLGLKQQQASVVQAWQSVKQSEEAASQGRSIMMFTVVTIFFLPLSFMASIFGMNAQEFGQGTVPIIRELKYMLPISFAIIIPIFILAFSTWIRALFWFVYKYTFKTTLVKTGLYGRWLNLDLPSQTLFDHASTQTEKLKNLVRAEIHEKKRRRMDVEWMESHNKLPLPSSSNDFQSSPEVATSSTNGESMIQSYHVENVSPR